MGDMDYRGYDTLCALHKFYIGYVWRTEGKICTYSGYRGVGGINIINIPISEISMKGEGSTRRS